MATTIVPPVLSLSDSTATDPALTGGKAAALARAARAGLPTLDGVVLTTAFSDDIDAGATIEDHPAVRAAYEAAGGRLRPLVGPIVLGG